MSSNGEKRRPANSTTGAGGTEADRAPSLARQMSRVKQVIGVMSGKGGVGKSLIAAMLAVVLRQSGRAVGVLDADITGPSIPKMFGLDGRSEGSEMGLFGPGRGPNAARAAGTPVLASIPVDPELSRLCDRGEVESYQRNPFDRKAASLESLLAGASAET